MTMATKTRPPTTMVNPDITYHVEVRSSRKNSSGAWTWTLDPIPYESKIDAEWAQMQLGWSKHAVRRIVMFLRDRVTGEVYRIAEFQRNAYRYH